MQTLLIVDDEMLIADGLHAMLSEAFAGRLNVRHCYSAAQALEIAGEMKVDILLTDINMPDSNGLELHMAIQKQYPDCQVVYLTGYSDFEYARTALDQHAFAYVLKGEGDDFLIGTIERALAATQTDTQTPPEPESVPQTDEIPGWLRHLHQYIQDHLNEDLSLNRLAESCNYNPVYLSHIYKEVTGNNISDFINQTRLKKAEDLLQNSFMTVHEISRVMGFATDNYFCRWFRKHAGYSPETFRKKVTRSRA